MIKFNVNNYVMVKLTDRGREIMRKNHDELKRRPKFEPPKEDSEGWSKCSYTT